MLVKSRTSTVNTWLKSLLKARKHYTTKQKKELKAAFALFEVVHNRYIFHSENSLNTSPKEVQQLLALYYQYESDFESICLTEEPAYSYEHHPLKELILFAQFAWFYYGLLESKSMLQTLWEWTQTRNAVNGSALFYVSELRSLRYSDLTEGQLSSVYLDATYNSKMLYYLAEIAEKEGDTTAAQAYYLQFAQIEYDFSPKCDFVQDEYYFYKKTDFPSVVTAWKRMGNLYLQQGERGKARYCFEYALKNGFTKFSPFRELAAIWEEEKQYAAAFNLILNELSTLLSYQYVPLDFEAYMAYCRMIGEKYWAFLGDKQYAEIVFGFAIRYYQKDALDYGYPFSWSASKAPDNQPNTYYDEEKIAYLQKWAQEINSPTLANSFTHFLFDTFLFARNLTGQNKKEKISQLLQLWLQENQIEPFAYALYQLQNYYSNKVFYSPKEATLAQEAQEVHSLKELGKMMEKSYRSFQLSTIITALESYPNKQ